MLLRLQNILAVVAVILASCGVLLFSYTGYSYVTVGENKLWVDSLLLSGLAAALGATVLSFRL